MSESAATFDAVRVARRTAETCFEIAISPRKRQTASLELPNRFLSHMLDHFCKAAGMSVELCRAQWPGSWAFDHVLCEDFGQLIGRGIAAIGEQLTSRRGIAGRGQATCCMDEALVEVVLSFESRPSARWTIPDESDIDGFVDSWTDSTGKTEGCAYGTNLRQFADGFAFGSGATLSVTVQRAGNLHHLYEAMFRALGDSVAMALGTQAGGRLPGDTSGLAGAVEYTVEVIDTDNDIAE